MSDAWGMSMEGGGMVIVVEVEVVVVVVRVVRVVVVNSNSGGGKDQSRRCQWLGGDELICELLGFVDVREM
jgi:hypothetical protein